LNIQEQVAQDHLRARISATVAGHWQQTLALGLLLELLGLVAFVLPWLSTLAVDLFVGWLLFIGGIARVVTLLRARHWPGYWWSMAAAVLAIVVGSALVLRPLAGMVTLTLVLGVVFFVEGISAIAAGLDFRHHARNWGWLLFNGLVDLLLVFLIWSGWPGTAVWAIGILVGINLFVTGLSLTVLSFTVRR
jgi:uncharacterized membrane protein HdeD (DUF308 family)